MTRKAESIFQDKVLADLRALPNTFAEKIQQQSINGTPDIIACICGRFVALELKSEDGRSKPLQDYLLMQVEKAGGLSYVVYPGQWDLILEALAILAGKENSFNNIEKVAR